MSEITVAAIQMKMTAQPAENIARAEALVREAAVQGVQIVLLPELFDLRLGLSTEPFGQPLRLHKDLGSSGRSGGLLLILGHLHAPILARVGERSHLGCVGLSRGLRTALRPGIRAPRRCAWLRAPRADAAALRG